MPAAPRTSLLVSALLHAAALTAAQVSGVSVKGPAYNPSYWNSTCKYSAYDVPPADFFRGQDYTDKSMAVPLHADGPGTSLYKYPVDACFGPTEKYDAGKVANGRKLPCQYRYNKAFRIDYWEEQPCATTLQANCYCYAINRFVGGFCVPGGAKNIGVKWTCDRLRKSIVEDGGTAVDYKTVQTTPPTGTHYIAAGISPDSSPQGNDFHVWRRDSNGAWSWKAGFTFARNTYRNGTLVRNLSDPNIRKMYPVLCGYFDVNSNTHKLYAGGTRSKFPARFDAWKKLGWKTGVARLATWSMGWYGLYRSVYVDQSYGDVAYGQQAAAAARRLGKYSVNLEAWRSQVEASPSVIRMRPRPLSTG